MKTIRYLSIFAFVFIAFGFGYTLFGAMLGGQVDIAIGLIFLVAAIIKILVEEYRSE